MAKGIKISVIVPVYNVEKYLYQCLNSLINQKLKDIEIICIDDCSTDNSYKILKEFAQIDKRIIILKQEKNLGQGAGRNYGIDIAKGEYIGFVDGDDYVDTNFYSTLYKTAKKYNVDIATTNILKHKKFYKKHNVHYKKNILKSDIQDKIELCKDKKQHFFYTTNKLYKTDFIRKNNIKFSERQIYEDVKFSIETIHLANAIVSVPGTTYHYVEHKKSSTKLKDEKGKKEQDLVIAYSYLQDYCKKFDIKLPQKLNYYKSLWYNPFIKTYLGNYQTKTLLFGIIPISKKNIDFTFPVDMVYLWVDNSDIEWKNKKQYWQNKINNIDFQAIDDGRFINNDELMFSLRSIDKYTPWINKIYIVTDNQIPKWLNINNSKVKIVFHKNFIPKDNLPLFNSNAIESFIPYIPDLSEHFIYGNDDMYINKYLNKYFFFMPNGHPIVRLKHQVAKKHIKNSMYTRSILKMQNIIKTDFGKSYPYAPHHNIDAYTKSSFKECLSRYKTDFKKTRETKFRSEEEFQRVIIFYYMLAKKYAKMKYYSRIDKYLSPYKRIKNRILKSYNADSIVINMKNKNPYSKIIKYNPALFCTNDGEGVSDFDRKRIKIFLEETFPQKSQFEL